MELELQEPEAQLEEMQASLEEIEKKITVIGESYPYIEIGFHTIGADYKIAKN